MAGSRHFKLANLSCSWTAATSASIRSNSLADSSLTVSATWRDALAFEAMSTQVMSREAVTRLRGAPAADGLAMMMNCNSLCRIDLLEHMDGTYSENSHLNAVAWTGLRQPSILWTYALDDHTVPELRAYFQQHLLM